MESERVPVTYRLRGAEAAAVELRFPVFWGPERRAPVAMRREGDAFVATVELPLGARVRHRYHVPTLDFSHAEQVEPEILVNRQLLVTGPRVVEDEVYAFAARTAVRPERLHGRVVDSGDGSPLLEAVVVADGVIVTTADGFFDVPVRDRVMDVTVFQVDGRHRAASWRLTPGFHELTLDPAPPARVRIEAIARLPRHHRLRLFATAAQVSPQLLFRNRFTVECHRDLVGGHLDLELREGQWVDYLYSLGNVALGQDRSSDRGVVRGFLARDGRVLRDRVDGLASEPTTYFEVTVPDETGQADVLTLRDLDPALLPMHRAGPSRWVLSASGRPLEGQAYRYAKSWSGYGDERAEPRTVRSSRIRDVIEGWRWDDGLRPDPVDVEASVAHPFRVVVTIPDWYGHEHALVMEPWLEAIAAQGFHGVVLNQVWGYESLEPSPRITRVGPRHSLYLPVHEALRTTRLARGLGLRVELEQQLVGAEHCMGDPRTLADGWWQDWFVQVERFNMESARMAEEAGIDALRVADAQPGIDCAAPFRGDFNAGMIRVIENMRSVYGGELVAAIDAHRPGPLDYWLHADRLVDVSPGLDLEPGVSQEVVDRWVADWMDGWLGARHDHCGLPMSVKLGVQSAVGALQGRVVPESEGIHSPRHEQSAELGHEEQRRLYEAFFKAAGDRPWMAEINVWLFGPTDAPLSRADDVRAKPAGALAAAWARALSARAPRVDPA